MASIKCAHCKRHHSTVSEVRQCAQGSPSKPVSNVVPMKRRDDSHDVPEGHYGLVSRSTGDTVMFRVDKPSEGRWRGYTFVKIWDDDAGDWVAVRAPEQRQSILSSIAQNVSAASKRYGVLTGVCGVCGHKLTTKVSRTKGIGPVCEKRLSA